MTERAAFTILVDGSDVTNRFTPYLEALTLRLYDGDRVDALELLLNDKDGQIRFPRDGAEVKLSLAWDGGGASLMFQGTTDEPTSRGDRQSGRLMALLAHGVDFFSPVKQKLLGHVDDATFGEAAEKFGKQAGVSVQVDAGLAQISRDYWSIQNESFMAWGKRIAAEIGATFKLYGGNATGKARAIFVPRNSGKSVSGRELSIVTAEWGKNLVAWELAPRLRRPRFKKAVVTYFNSKTSKLERAEATVPDRDGGPDVSHIDARAFANKEQAISRAQANAAEIARGKGGGWVLIDGDPAAQPQAPLVVSGVRPGIDGTYRIASVTHTLTRAAGWLTECEVEEPSGAAGEDER
jgi:phage protein D